MGTYTVQEITSAGVVPTANAVAASDVFTNNGRTILEVTNGSGSELTVSFTMTKTVDGETPGPKQVTIANGATKVIGPFSKDFYNDANGQVTVAYDEQTSVTAKCLTF